VFDAKKTGAAFWKPYTGPVAITQENNMDLNATEVTINGKIYIPKELAGPIVLGPCRIIVADRGWVFVGNCEDHTDGSVTISNAKNIRNWGTSRGLGELANGPLVGKTKFDEYGTVRCIPIVQISVNSGW
jgi:hypothetical protein